GGLRRWNTLREPQGDMLPQGDNPPQGEIGGLRRWNTLREPQGDITPQGDTPPKSQTRGLRRWNTIREPHGDMTHQRDITFNTFPKKCENFFHIKGLSLNELKNSYISVKKLTLMKISIIPMRMRIT